MRRIVALRRFDMGLDANLANGDPMLAALIPDGVTLNHILALFRDVCPVNGEQRLCQRLRDLGATHPSNLAIPKLAEFIEYLLGALKSGGIKDPAARLAEDVQREHKAAAAKLASSAEIGNIEAQPKSSPTPVKLENSPAGTSAASSPPVAQAIADGTTKAEEERQPDQPATNTAPQTIANPEVRNPETANARDEIVIDGRRLVGERRVAEMLGCSLRTLQRRRKEGKGPLSTKIGRKVYYELNDLQGWIDGGKIR
jgi:Helix-turn-helix domain